MVPVEVAKTMLSLIYVHTVCPLLNNPINGNIMYSEEGIYNVTYTCNDNYRLVGPSSRTCDEDEEGVYAWSGTQPECISKSTALLISR